MLDEMIEREGAWSTRQQKDEVRCPEQTIRPRVWIHERLTVLGLVAAVGFTVALFFATAAFPDGELLDQTKMGRS